MIGIFIVLVSYFTTLPVISPVRRALFPFVVILGLIFLILGIALIYLTKKQKIKGKQKIFLILTGVSALCPFIFSILHNFFYALAIITSHITLLNYLMEILHIASFFIALLISPIGFLVGVVGTITLKIKKKERLKPSS